jgi:hypothetical protein
MAGSFDYIWIAGLIVYELSVLTAVLRQWYRLRGLNDRLVEYVFAAEVATAETLKVRLAWYASLPSMKVFVRWWSPIQPNPYDRVQGSLTGQFLAWELVAYKKGV